MNETLDRSSLGAIAARSSVNLELALRASDRLGGHIVQGHVDGLGTVARVREDGFARIITIAAPPELLRYVVHKGSIAVDGVSLTVARIDDGGFDVSADPADARAHEPRCRRGRARREPRGRRAGQAWGEAARAVTARRRVSRPARTRRCYGYR